MPILDHHTFQFLQHQPEQAYVPQVAAEVLERLGVHQLAVRGAHLAAGPVLVVSNHPGGLDPFAQWAAIQRPDVYQVSLLAYHSLGPLMRRRTCPVYHSVRWKDRVFAKLHPTYQPQLATMAELTQQQVRHKNRLSLLKAAKLLDQGKVVVIYPTGSIGQPVSGFGWKAGVAKILAQTSRPDIRILWSRISGTDSTDLLRYLHPSVRETLFYPKSLQVAFWSGPTRAQLQERWPTFPEVPAATLTDWLAHHYHRA